jgi:hypothetical protein
MLISLAGLQSLAGAAGALAAGALAAGVVCAGRCCCCAGWPLSQAAKAAITKTIAKITDTVFLTLKLITYPPERLYSKAESNPQ